MDIKKVQVATFAIRNRLLGYQLLKNPKGSSPYQVKMMKKWSGISPELDRFDHYHTKSRDFSRPDEKTAKETLLVNRYMFWKSKNEKSVKKEVFYNKTNSKGEFTAKNKMPVTYEELENRDTSYINKTRTKKEETVILPPFFPLDIVKEESVASKQIDKFFENKRKQNNTSKANSFWSTLISNLNNK